MAPRRGPKSLKQATQDSIVHSIVLKDVSADVLNKAPTHMAVAIMKQVTDRLKRSHKAAMAKSNAMLKQKQCQLNIAERQLAAISRVFERIWGMLTQPEASLDIVANGYHCQIAWDRSETNMKAPRRIDVSTSGTYNPSVFSNEPVSSWGIESWALSPAAPRPTPLPDTRADYMVRQTLVGGSTCRKVTDPFL